MNIAELQEKTSQKLQADGFEVLRHVEGSSGVHYDLVARREGQTIVFEFKKQSSLNSESVEISRLRQSARQDGYNDFRVVVVPEEEPNRIQIQGLDLALLKCLQNDPGVKNDKLLMNANAFFKWVGQVHVSSLSTGTKPNQLTAVGVAVAEFVTNPSTNEPVWDCPLYFDVQLEPNGKFIGLNNISLDLSSISADLQEYLEEEQSSAK